MTASGTDGAYDAPAQPSAFEQSNAARQALAELSNLSRHEGVWTKAFPRWHDDGFRPAHLVLQGGGTLGIAHVGFMRGLEEVGIRFAGLAGTSAGAIIALLGVAARKSIASPVSQRLIPCLEAMPASTFIDGPHRARRVVKGALRGESMLSLEWAIPMRAALRRILSHYALNPGVAFEAWLTELLAERFEMRTLLDLQARLKVTATELAELGFPQRHHLSLLHIIATAMPLGLKFTLPADVSLLAASVWHRSPAVLARASMAVPLFFEPLEIELDSAQWLGYVESRLSTFFGDETLRVARTFRSVSFVDGGTLSNFPVDAFLDIAGANSWRERGEGAPNNYAQGAKPNLSFGKEQITNYAQIPTIGAALLSGQSKQSAPPVGSLRALIVYANQLATAIRRQRDVDGYRLAEMLANQLDDQRRPLFGYTKVALIDVTGHNWLNFDLHRDEMQDLFEKGLRHAVKFIESFERADDGARPGAPIAGY